MRHLRHNSTPPLDFIRDVIKSKKSRDDDKVIVEVREKCRAEGKKPPDNLTYKERCYAILENNKKEVQTYESAFASDNLAIVPQGVPILLNGAKQDCDDMDSLYSFGSSPMSRLWVEVLSTDGYLNDLCPVCGAIKATTFDHYLPQSSYQLFAVHPLNLIPSCTECNGHKLKNVFDSQRDRLYWNAYLDYEVNDQYLFCDISEENGTPKALFRVEQGNLPDRYFEIVKNTFNDLCAKTYRDCANRLIVELKDSCCIFYFRNQEYGLDGCLQMVSDTIPNTKVNDWETVLKRSLIGTEVFKRFVIMALESEYQITL